MDFRIPIVVGVGFVIF